MKHSIFKVVMFGLLVGFICALASMMIGLFIYFITFSISIPLALTILKYSTFISFGIGLCGTTAVYIYFLYLVWHFIKHGIKL